jgi:hypothetical protein
VSKGLGMGQQHSPSSAGQGRLLRPSGSHHAGLKAWLAGSSAEHAEGFVTKIKVPVRRLFLLFGWEFLPHPQHVPADPRVSFMPCSCDEDQETRS